MDNFAMIYKILKTLEKAMDCEQLDINAISAESLGVSGNRFGNILEMLADEGYIKGLTILKSIGGKSIRYDKIQITLRGLEYLYENEHMKKAYNAAKGTVE